MSEQVIVDLDTTIKATFPLRPLNDSEKQAFNIYTNLLDEVLVVFNQAPKDLDEFRKEKNDIDSPFRTDFMYLNKSNRIKNKIVQWRRDPNRSHLVDGDHYEEFQRKMIVSTNAKKVAAVHLLDKFLTNLDVNYKYKIRKVRKFRRVVDNILVSNDVTFNAGVWKYHLNVVDPGENSREFPDQPVVKPWDFNCYIMRKVNLPENELRLPCFDEIREVAIQTHGVKNWLDSSENRGVDFCKECNKEIAVLENECGHRTFCESCFYHQRFCVDSQGIVTTDKRGNIIPCKEIDEEQTIIYVPASEKFKHLIDKCPICQKKIENVTHLDENDIMQFDDFYF